MISEICLRRRFVHSATSPSSAMRKYATYADGLTVTLKRRTDHVTPVWRAGLTLPVWRTGITLGSGAWR